MFALIGSAYGVILRPLIEELQRGRDVELFTDIEPEGEALSK